ncbi:hypothetical protein KSZ_70980 [Dictyobacter formicarum]|uniref:JAB domain-containing protein n=1 Tax=Dictyobacter formicarum TaxID=2778368 RepID=A0ABQ3VT87_9CHLR|nr:hypothetical protein KSZ_70980 [Dictyobacter formicarum]
MKKSIEKGVDTGMVEPVSTPFSVDVVTIFGENNYFLNSMRLVLAAPDASRLQHQKKLISCDIIGYVHTHTFYNTTRNLRIRTPKLLSYRVPSGVRIKARS